MINIENGERIMAKMAKMAKKSMARILIIADIDCKNDNFFAIAKKSKKINGEWL